MNFMKVRYSQFDLSSLVKYLSEIYSLPEPLHCHFFRNGLNDVYKVTDNTGSNYFLRVSLAGVHTISEIEEEIEWIIACRSAGLDVVEPIPCRSGSYVMELVAPEGTRPAVLFREIRNTPAGDPETLYKNLGQLIAGLHIVPAESRKSSWRPMIDQTLLSTHPLELLKPYLSHRMTDYEFMVRTNSILWNFITEELKEDPTVYGICHGDIQPGNYYFHGEKPVLFDFDCMGYGYYAYDLGVLLANLTFADNDIYKKSIWAKVLEGYSSVRPLKSQEVRSAYAFAALQMMRVLAYHVELTGQNNGIFYYTSDPHLDMFIGAYRRLYDVTCTECGISDR